MMMLDRIEGYLKQTGIDRKDVTNIKSYVAMVLASKLTNDVKPTAELIVEKVSPSRITDGAIQGALTMVWTQYEALAATQDRDDVARGGELLERLLDQIAFEWKEG